MLSFLRQLVATAPASDARNAYIALVERARNPFFYETLEVPDTLDGRFEMILVHLFLMQRRLLKEKDGPSARDADDFSRVLSELFFEDMDRSLREIGVSDTGVRYRIKAMAKAYHGRLQVYTKALEDREQLKTALARNVYGTVAEGSPAVLDGMADYIYRMSEQLDAMELSVLFNAELPELALC